MFKYCPNCTKEVQPSWKCCPYCGNKFDEAAFSFGAKSAQTSPLDEAIDNLMNFAQQRQLEEKRLLEKRRAEAEQMRLLKQFKYSSNGDGTYTITAVGDMYVTSIVIPECVTDIAYNAFNGCIYLKSVELPKSLKSIAHGAFASCSSLRSITIPNGVKVIGSYAFLKCFSLSSVEIPDGVKTIEMYAFSRCTNLTSVNIPNTVTYIGESAFMGCDRIHSICIPYGCNCAYNAFPEDCKVFRR